MLVTTGHIRDAIVRFAPAAGLCVLMLLLLVPPIYAQVSEDVLKRHISDYANELCGLCHDVRTGNERAPRIAGQQRAYIEAQLNAFRRTSRAEPEASDCMWGLSSALSDGLVATLATYFAAQTRLPGIPGDPVQIQAGRELFRLSSRSCAQCHGEDAKGGGTVPGLAGQLAPYLVRQMQVIRLRFRDSATMHGIVQDLTDEQLRSVATYLQSL